MIRVFGQTDKTYLSNGDVVLRPIKAKVTKKDNGDYYLDLETDLTYVDYLVEGNIIVANTPTGDQAFRIDNVVKNKNKLVSKCWHVFYDSKNYLIADSFVENKDCNDALNHLNNATEPVSEFTVSSNVTTVDSFRCVRKSLYEAIQTVLERWGGHLIRNNFDIEVRSSIGQDNGIIVQYKKNLKEITCQENWDNVVTKILPVGKDGLLLNALNPSASIYIESATQYDLPYTKTVTFAQDDIEQENYATETAYTQALVDDLEAQATEYLSQNCVPQINYTLKANLDRVTDIGDIIQVIDERLGVNMTTNVIGFVYDCIFEKYSEVEFGNFTQTLSGLVSTITGNIDRTVGNQIIEATTSVNNQIGEKVANPAKKDYDVGEYVVYNDTFCKVVSPIAQGSNFSIGTNLSVSTVGDELEIIQSGMIDKIYPVGSIYVSVNSTSPATLFGGEWEQIKDTFLLACGDSYENGETGGEAEHTLTVDEIPAHSHGLEYSTDNGTTYADATIGKDGATTGASNFGGSQSIEALASYQARIKETGGGQAHNNMPPYLAVYTWQRIS